MVNKMPKIQQSLITRINQEKGKKSYSNYKLAAVSGVAESTVGRVLKGEVLPTISTLIKLADALQIDLKDLL
ncbi:helix-turn-helix domain-containing protein [Holdemania massiliensis]|uniref:helix-turn-helix domain-containing protein n=1 Tax=Holdemania massiliensis TaxID=1468449 RepID=UPI001F058A79|nr:helix-turn-helix transcriptional regulator [Holdemania massiliensis]MCH1942448.1 helix-turn-helix domain-containing protein [Holdemania massiliensis]